MPRRTKLRPLTDAEERALIHLADVRDGSTSGAGYSTAGWRNDTTIYRLRDLGMVELDTWPSSVRARITDEGYALVRSMGD